MSNSNRNRLVYHWTVTIIINDFILWSTNVALDSYSMHSITCYGRVFIACRKKPTLDFHQLYQLQPKKLYIIFDIWVFPTSYTHSKKSD